MERHPPPDIENFAGVLDRRFEAFLIDAIVVAVIVGVLGYIGGVLFVGRGLALASAAVAIQFGGPFVVLGYHTAFEGYYGRTIGKHLRGVVVVGHDGADISWGSAIIRNLLRLIDGLPAFYILGVVVAYATDKHQRLGDLAGGTVVVYTQD